MKKRIKPFSESRILKPLRSLEPKFHWRYERNGEEFILDFIGTSSQNGRDIAEHQIFRFLPFVSQKDKKGVLVLSFFHRAYDKEIFFFLKNAKNTERQEISESFKKLPIPTIKF